MGKVKKIIIASLGLLVFMLYNVSPKAESTISLTLNSGSNSSTNVNTSNKKEQNTILDGVIGPYHPQDQPNFSSGDISGTLPTDYYTIKATVPTNMQFILYNNTKAGSMLISPQYSITNNSMSEITVKAKSFVMQDTVNGQSRPSDTVPLYIGDLQSGNDKVEMDLKLDFTSNSTTTQANLKNVFTEKSTTGNQTSSTGENLGKVAPEDTANMKFSVDKNGYEMPIDEGVVKSVVSDYKLILELSVD